MFPGWELEKRLNGLDQRMQNLERKKGGMAEAAKLERCRGNESRMDRRLESKKMLFNFYLAIASLNSS